MVVLKPRKRGRTSAVQGDDSPHNSLRQRFNSNNSRVKENSLSLNAVRHYIARYKISPRQPMTFKGFLCHGSAGQSTETVKCSNRSYFKDASSTVKDHLRAGVIKEGEAIAEFIYSVQLKDRDLKVPLDMEIVNEDNDESKHD